MSFTRYKINYPKTLAYEKAKYTMSTRDTLKIIESIGELSPTAEIKIKKKAYDSLVNLLHPLEQIQAKNGMRWNFVSVVPV